MAGIGDIYGNGASVIRRSAANQKLFGYEAQKALEARRAPSEFVTKLEGQKHPKDVFIPSKGDE